MARADDTMAMMGSLRICLLGRFEVERDGTALPPAAWRRSRPADLLKILSLSSGRSLHREELIDRLWPDKDLDRGANNLHRCLHDLRQVLGPDWVTPDKGVVRLHPDAWIDVVEFERLVQADSLAEAIAVRSEEHTSELQSLRHIVCP